VGIDSNETSDDMTTSDGHHQKNTTEMAATHQCHHDVVGHAVPQSSAAHVVHVHGNAAASFIDGAQRWARLRLTRDFVMFVSSMRRRGVGCRHWRLVWQARRSRRGSLRLAGVESLDKIHPASADFLGGPFPVLDRKSSFFEETSSSNIGPEVNAMRINMIIDAMHIPN
jgi:hypothetical protein